MKKTIIYCVWVCMLIGLGQTNLFAQNPNTQPTPTKTGTQTPKPTTTTPTKTGTQTPKPTTTTPTKTGTQTPKPTTTTPTKTGTQTPKPTTTTPKPAQDSTAKPATALPKPVPKKYPPIKKTFEGEITYEIKVGGKGATQIQSLFPTKMILGIRCGEMRCRYENAGVMDSIIGELYINGDSNLIFRVLPHYKLIQEKRMPLPPLRFFKNSDPKVAAPKPGTPAAAPEVVLGYQTKRETLIFDAHNGLGRCKITQLFAPDIVVEPLPALVSETGSLLLMPGVTGFPLLRIFDYEKKEIKITIKAISIKKMNLPNNYFQLPQDFRRERFNPAQRTFPTLPDTREEKK